MPGSPGRSVAFIYDERCLDHSNGARHPERPERIRAIRDHLERNDLLGRLRSIRPEPCPIERIETVHTPAYIETLRAACQGAPAQLDPDTGVSSGSWEAALLSAGGALAACDAVYSGNAAAAFSCCRPPGHHAEADRAMGFCLFNNVAIAARYLQTGYRLGKILIVDWDVHHGNGTQHMFEDDGTVLYFSTHQFPHYPGTGARNEKGVGRGEGTTLNVPLPAGSGDRDYLRVFRTILRPAIDRFSPNAILISCGFDAHRDDPLAGMEVTEEGYAEMTAILKEAANDHCEGRVISFLEGGYDLGALGRSAEAHLRALGAFDD